MTEYLFKLKKDGKAVGYLEIFAEDGEVVFRKDLIDDMDCDIWEQGICDFNTAHPFVTKDKNGKDVFEDDPVWFHWKGKKTKGKIIKEGFFWKYESSEKFSRTLCSFDISHIELIEDKPNDNN